MSHQAANDNSDNQTQRPDGRWVPAEGIRFHSPWRALRALLSRLARRRGSRP